MKSPLIFLFTRDDDFAESVRKALFKAPLRLERERTSQGSPNRPAFQSWLEALNEICLCTPRPANSISPSSHGGAQVT
jgi:hypothetical protein